LISFFLGYQRSVQKECLHALPAPPNPLPIVRMEETLGERAKLGLPDSGIGHVWFSTIKVWKIYGDGMGMERGKIKFALYALCFGEKSWPLEETDKDYIQSILLKLKIQ